MELWHGSQKIVEVPQFGLGKVHNDYELHPKTWTA